MNRKMVTLVLLWFSAPFAGLPAVAVTIPTVPVGNAGNAGEAQLNGTFGAVAFEYRIGTYEVTNAQYAEFLNTKAASDPLGLYNADMGSTARGGITRSGISGSFTYAVRTDMGNKPVSYVSWFDTLRFANWLNNGQGSGDTETGAYTLLGETPTPSNSATITRNPGATWFLPSENEWYKAAYYDPTLNSGAGGYWDYPTHSNVAPTLGLANTVGDISNPGANVANYNFGAVWNGQSGNLTTVGSAGPLSQSFYGTSDQGGNIFEWTETRIGSFGILRGGSWILDPPSLAAATSYMFSNLSSESRLPQEGMGFRVATVPEPSTFVLTATALAAALAGTKLTRRRTVHDL